MNKKFLVLGAQLMSKESAPGETKDSNKTDPKELFKWMLDCHNKGFLLTASSQNMYDGKNETNSYGIVGSHAYAILEVIDNKKHNVQLLKLRNPWGSTEWKGKWNKKDVNLTQSIQNQAELTKSDMTSDNGIFLMDVNDYVHFFTQTKCSKVHDNYHYNSVMMS